MKAKSRLLGLCHGLCGMLFSVNGYALSPIAEQQGWGGYVMFGGGYTEVKSNTVAGNNIIEGGKDSIQSINQNPRTSDVTHLIAGTEIKYTLANRNEIFFGSSLEDFLTMDFGSQLGWRRQTDKAGIFQLGYLFSGVPTEVWKDPYLTGVKRDETERDTEGVRFVWDRIMGSAFELTTQVRRLDIGQEKSGSDPELDCDDVCQSLLDRNGDQYQLMLSYTFIHEGRHVFRPQLRLRHEDRNGESTSRDAYGLQMTYSYLGPRWTFVTNLLYGQSDFDRPNPLYGIRQDADTVAVDATLLYRLPFGEGRWQAMGILFWGESDSDIDFHDDQLGSIMLGVIYHFGNQPGSR